MNDDSGMMSHLIDRPLDAQQCPGALGKCKIQEIVFHFRKLRAELERQREHRGIMAMT